MIHIDLEQFLSLKDALLQAGIRLPSVIIEEPNTKSPTAQRRSFSFKKLEFTEKNKEADHAHLLECMRFLKFTFHLITYDSTEQMEAYVETMRSYFRDICSTKSIFETDEEEEQGEEIKNIAKASQSTAPLPGNYILIVVQSLITKFTAETTENNFSIQFIDFEKNILSPTTLLSCWKKIPDMMSAIHRGRFTFDVKNYAELLTMLFTFSLTMITHFSSLENENALTQLLTEQGLKHIRKAPLSNQNEEKAATLAPA